MFHCSPSTGKLRMTPISFLKTMESYDVSLVSINWQTSYDSDILPQDNEIIRCFTGLHQLANLVWLRYPSSRQRNHTIFHWSPSTGKPRMTPISFLKTTKSYDVSLVSINWQTSYDSDILPQDNEIIRCFTGLHQLANLV